MNKVQQLIVLAGLAIFLTSISLFTLDNNAFALEFSNYTSLKDGIMFEYPSDWKLVEKTSRFDSGPDLMIADYSSNRNINIIFPDSFPSSAGELLDTYGLERLVELLLNGITDDFGSEYKTIEEPSTISIDGKETGTFLFTSQDKYDDFAIKYAKQFWLSYANDKLYQFTYISPTTTFDNLENVEIRDHFINSIKFLGDSEIEVEPQQKSRFD